MRPAIKSLADELYASTVGDGAMILEKFVELAQRHSAA